MATLAVSGALLHRRAALEHTGRILLPGGHIGHIATPRSQPPAYSPWLSVRQFDALARHACATPGRLALHGELAATFDFAQGVATRLHCPPERLPRLGGIAAEHHLAGIPTGFAAELGLAVEPQVLAPEQGRDADVDVRYRTDRQTELDAQGDTALSGQLTCTAGELLAITNLMPFLNRLAREVHRDGIPLAPLAETRATAYYPCEGSELHWRVRTPDPASADVFVIQRHGR